MIDLSEIDSAVQKLPVKLPGGTINIEYRTQVYTSKYVSQMTGREVHDVLPELLAGWDLVWKPVVEVEVGGPDDPKQEVVTEGGPAHQYQSWTDLGVVEREEKQYRRLQGPEAVPAPITPEWIGDRLGLKIGNLILRAITQDQFPNVR